MKKIFWLIQTGRYNPVKKDEYDYFIVSGDLFGKKNAYIQLNCIFSNNNE